MRATTKFLSLALQTSLLLCLAAGCGPSENNSDGTENNSTTPETTQTFEVVQEREAFSGEHDYDLARTMQEANTAFAFDMYAKLRGGENKNLVISPFSISRAFSNYYKGAADSSVKPAFEQVFRFDEQMDNESWKMLTAWVSDRSGYEDVPEAERSLFVSNDIYWIDDSDPSKRGNFDRTHMLDLNGEPEKSRQIINDWIEEKSFGLLEDFLDEGLIDPDTEAVTTNVVFFAGAWDGEMQEKPAISFQADGGAQETSAFGQSYEEGRAGSTEELSVATIPYAHEYHMVVMMPHGDFEAFASSLSAERYDEILGMQGRVALTFSMPEFDSASNPDIVGAIDALRKDTGTDGGGTLTGAFRETYIHKANISVSKEGTRAAAATVIIEYGNSEPEPAPPLSITFDKPFVYTINDRSGNVLFMGEYTGK